MRLRAGRRGGQSATVGTREGRFVTSDTADELVQRLARAESRRRRDSDLLERYWMAVWGKFVQAQERELAVREDSGAPPLEPAAQRAADVETRPSSSNFRHRFDPQEAWEWVEKARREMLPVAGTVRWERGPGRNEACRCGRKSKRCCGA